MGKRLTTEQFIANARKVHGTKYDYSKVQYINRNTKITIVCPKHGEFKQTPIAHVHYKQGCMKCAIDNRSIKFSLGRDRFIEKAIEIHGNRYDYSKVEYVNIRLPITIICPEHGEFKQTPNDHLYARAGCPKCKYQKASKLRSWTTEQFVELSTKIHQGKYDYSITEYVRNDIKVSIICSKHGEFEQYPNSHIHQHVGCPRCSIEKRVSNDELDIQTLLRDLDVQFDSSNRSIIAPLELDLYVPDYKFAIEFNGVYWHNITMPNITFGYHVNKSNRCASKQIRLLHIFEHLWNANRLKYEMLIKYACGVITAEQLWPYVWDDYKLLSNEMIIVNRDTYIGELECVGYYIHAVLPPIKFVYNQNVIFNSGQLLLKVGEP